LLAASLVIAALAHIGWCAERAGSTTNGHARGNPARANTLNVVRTADYTARSFPQPPEPIMSPSASPLEPLRRESSERPPGSRTQAATVDAPNAIPAPQEEYVIDLPTTVRLVASANPTIAQTRELVRETLTLQTRARAMLLPSLNGGVAFHNHDGNFQASTGQIRYMYSKSLYYGGGTRVWAAESLAVPMVRLFSHLGDAIYEPLAVRQQVSMRQFDSVATANTIVLESVNRYFELLAAEGRYEAARQTERETAEIVRITASYAMSGEGREGDANRARTEAYLMHVEVQRAEERVAVASSRLAEILSLDPSVRLKTVGGPISGIEIVDPDTELQALIQAAERRRPELMSASANIQYNNTRVRQEQTRPLFPLILMGYSAGSFGGGSVLFPPQLGNFRGRQDFDVMALWSLSNLGVGNWATVKERRAVLNQSVAERTRALNGIRQEVIAAYALVRGELVQVQVTQRQLADSEQGFREEFARLLGAEALPIEVLNSVDQLGFARQELIKAVTGFNQAQFRLFVATGSSPTQANLPATTPDQQLGPRPAAPARSQP
jgi:outer membrane protein TolC